MANGYMGKILWVDLSRREFHDEALEEKLCRQFLGGYGLGARILFSRQPPGVDPLGPDNHLGFLTGPLTGSALGGSRYVVVGKSPLTGTWGDANSGGYFGPCLKFSGYDGVFIYGISEKPVYLFIHNGVPELKDAAHLWGKDCFETEDLIRSESGKDVEVACIGPSGEKVSLIAAIMNNKGRAAARSGLGAVMGSKKLKAVAVKGDMKVPVFDEAKTRELRKKVLAELTGPLPMFRQFGTPALTVRLSTNGDTPVKNWAGVGTIDFPEVDLIGVNRVIDRQAKKYACWKCPVGCGGRMKAGSGEYDYGLEAHKPEYETLGMFGANCLNSNIESIIKVNDICNRYGLDTISAGATIAMAIDCYENGIITTKDTNGIEMTWGNHKAIVDMMEKMARREGFGAVLADGARVAADKIGNGADLCAMHIQGQEYGAHDPKLLASYATGYRMDATPGRHSQSGAQHPPGLPFPPADPKAGRGQTQRIGVCFNQVVNSLGLCTFVYGTYPNAGVVVDFLNAITGWSTSVEELLVTGQRIASVRMSFTIREGLNPLLYKAPDRVIGIPPKRAGPLAGITVDEKTLDRDYCIAMDWDPRTCKPSEDSLLKMGMRDVAEVLWP